MKNKVQKFLISTLLLITPFVSQAMSKPDYGQVDIVVKNNQPCFYLSGYTREVATADDTNKLTYAILFEGSKDLFIVNNVYLDIPNNPQSCLLVTDMEALTSEPNISLDKPYGIELKLGIKDEVINGANYVSEFCVTEKNSRYKIVEVDYKINPDPTKNATDYCSNKEFKEEKSWFQELKEWLSGFFG
nr:hypothetical protein [uncultured Psychrobacter sp.]